MNIMWFQAAIFCFCLCFNSSAYAEDFMQDILDALTEMSDAMVSVSNVKLAANQQDQKSENGRAVFRTDEKEVVVLFELYGVAKGEAIDSVWSLFQDGAYVAFGKASITVPEDFKNKANFRLELDKGITRPPGKYKVDIIFKEKVLHSAYMQLVGAATPKRKPSVSRPSAKKSSATKPAPIQPPLMTQVFQDKVLGLRARYPESWEVQCPSPRVCRFVPRNRGDAGMVHITVQQLAAHSRGGNYENLESLVNEIKISSLSSTQNVNITAVESFEYNSGGVNWKGVSFEVKASHIEASEPYRQIFFLLHDTDRNYFVNCNYMASLSIFEKYEVEAGQIIDSFDFSLGRKDLWWQ